MTMASGWWQLVVEESIQVGGWKAPDWKTERNRKIEKPQQKAPLTKSCFAHLESWGGRDRTSMSWQEFSPGNHKIWDMCCVCDMMGVPAAQGMMYFPFLLPSVSRRHEPSVHSLVGPLASSELQVVTPSSALPGLLLDITSLSHPRLLAVLSGMNLGSSETSASHLLEDTRITRIRSYFYLFGLALHILAIFWEMGGDT